MNKKHFLRTFCSFTSVYQHAMLEVICKLALSNTCCCCLLDLQADLQWKHLCPSADAPILLQAQRIETSSTSVKPESCNFHLKIERMVLESCVIHTALPRKPTPKSETETLSLASSFVSELQSQHSLSLARVAQAKPNFNMKSLATLFPFKWNWVPGVCIISIQTVYFDPKLHFIYWKVFR